MKATCGETEEKSETQQRSNIDQADPDKADPKTGANPAIETGACGEKQDRASPH